MKFLVWRGAVVQAENWASYTPLHHAAWSGHTHVARFLLSRGAAVTAPTKGGLTPLHVAAANGHTLVTQLLLGWGADPAGVDVHQWSALHWATANNQLHVMELLVAQGADPGLGSKDGGIRPLHVAAEIGRTEALRFLLAKGANVNLQDSLGRTPLSLASHNGHHEVRPGIFLFLMILKPRHQAGRCHREEPSLVQGGRVVQSSGVMASCGREFPKPTERNRWQRVAAKRLSLRIRSLLVWVLLLQRTHKEVSPPQLVLRREEHFPSRGGIKNTVKPIHVKRCANLQRDLVAMSSTSLGSTSRAPVIHIDTVDVLQESKGPILTKFLCQGARGLLQPPPHPVWGLWRLEASSR